MDKRNGTDRIEGKEMERKKMEGRKEMEGREGNGRTGRKWKEGKVERNGDRNTKEGG